MIQPAAKTGSGVETAGGVESIGKRLENRLPNCAGLVPVEIHYAKRKRLLDIFGSLILIVLLSPVFLLLILLIKILPGRKGPVFYASERIGLCGVPFKFLKFRSMYQDADQRLNQLLGQNEKDGPIFKMKDDPRITPLGKFMRKYSLDELPQLFNVFRGDMSLVGPRPPLRREVEQYDPSALERLTVRPGITCYWQIMGRSELSFKEWIELDQRYIREMGVFTDLKILLKTPLAVIRGQGAY